jgi:hypothetical protein
MYPPFEGVKYIDDDAQPQEPSEKIAAWRMVLEQ